MVKTKQKFTLFLQRFREAWLACLLCMVQGDFTVVTLKHAITAAKTGSIAGIAFVALSFSKKLKGNIYAATWTIGVLTTIADYIIHPTHFGPPWTEAVVTGVAAAALGFCMMKWVDPKVT